MNKSKGHACWSSLSIIAADAAQRDRIRHSTLPESFFEGTKSESLGHVPCHVKMHVIFPQSGRIPRPCRPIIHIPIQVAVARIEAEWVLADPAAHRGRVPAGVVVLQV